MSLQPEKLSVKKLLEEDSVTKVFEQTLTPLDDGELEYIPPTLEQLLDWKGKKFSDLSPQEDLLLFHRDQYEWIKNRRLRMMLFRFLTLIFVGTIIGSISEGQFIIPEEAFWSMLLLLFLWGYVESTFTYTGHEDFVLEAMIPDFGYETRKERQWYERDMNRCGLTQAENYTFARADKRIREQGRIVYRNTYGNFWSFSRERKKRKRSVTKITPR